MTKPKEVFSGLCQKIVNLLYPPVCPLCDRTLPPGEQGRLCDKCFGLVNPIKEPRCFKCGRQLDTDDKEYCEQCRKRIFHFERGYIIFNYEDKARDMLLKLKYNGRKDIAEYFGNTVLEVYGTELKKIGAQAVVPVPIHKKRLNKRGYNQAQAVAYIIGKQLNIPCVEDLLVRVKQTEAQKELTATERLINLYDAFEIDEGVLADYKKRTTLEKVILVDDIFTTGSTIECCSIILKKYGVREVYFVSVAGTRRL